MIYLLLTLLMSQPLSDAPAIRGFTDRIEIPAYGNSWVVSEWQRNKAVISKNGITGWTQSEDVIRTYFRSTTTGNMRLSLKGHLSSGNSRIKVTCGTTAYEVDLIPSDNGVIEVGTFDVDEQGYHYIELRGIEKSGATFVDIEAFVVDGPVATAGLTFVNEDFYWGRRGPSVHLTYQPPADRDIEYFYNEITVPDGEDVVGSYFMSCGFAEGYFGMQVNSEMERRILFSVWSPYKTQNPDEIPEGYKILLQGKGEGVYTGEFGNEGSGGQSYWKYMWKAGTTYRFLLKGVPVDANSTDYTAYFYAPEQGEWKLIASFRRPHTSSWLKRPHSFLENFSTQTGFISRKGYYSNQWVRDSGGEWHEMTRARFTADATARKGSRLDYAGGVEGGRFFMKNCGFFDETTKIDTWFERPSGKVEPNIDLDLLPE